MALEPGDNILEDECKRVGNFPHGILKGPSNLQLDPGVLGSTMCLESRKQDYVDAFAANDLAVCNESDFAKKGSPYIVKLSRDDGPDPGEETSQKYYIELSLDFAAYSVGAAGPPKWPFPDSNHWESNIAPGHGQRFSINCNRRSGSVSGDIWNGPGIVTKIENRLGWGSFYNNSNLLATVDLSYIWSGPLNGSFDDISVSMTALIRYSNDASTSVETIVTPSGFGASINETFTDLTENWLGDDGESVGTLQKIVQVSAHVSALDFPTSNPICSN